MKVIAITGGIGSGKTAAADYLISLGYKVIDADLIAHRITAPGGRAIPFIRKYFGEEFIKKDGSMDRDKIRHTVYADKHKLELLKKGTTSIVKDEVASLVRDAKNKCETGALFVVIPLLFEEGGNDGTYDEVWVISADINTRIERVRERDGLDYKTIKLIMSSQAEEAVRLEGADKIIYNNGDFDELRAEVDVLLSRIKSSAKCGDGAQI